MHLLTSIDAAVSAQAVSGWLTGKSLPRQANLLALAKMLWMAPHDLQYGSSESRQVGETGKTWRVAAADQLAVDAFLSLPPPQRKLVRELVAVLAEAAEAGALR